VNVATIIGLTIGVLAGVAGFIMMFGRRNAPRMVGTARLLRLSRT
jgi:hypothetical protein